jgi:hypothetical protein
MLSEKGDGKKRMLRLKSKVFTPAERTRLGKVLAMRKNA